MDQNDAELDFHAADFPQLIDQPGNEMPSLHEDEAPEAPVELSSHCDEAEYEESLQGSPNTGNPPLSSSDDVAPASEPAGEVVLTEEVSASVALDAETMIAVDDTVVADMAQTENTVGVAVEENSTVMVDVVDSGPVKRKRGRPRKNPEAKAPPPVRKKEREDVCFVCFDRRNPNLVACNRRGCYKAYHPTCVSRDDAFFRSKGKWNCGWHICSTCQKAAHYMCYTCTTSFCKECVTDETKYVCVRGTYGFCQSCHNTVTLIELNKLAFEKKDGSDFDDTDSFTYLFKAYWLDRKGKLLLTPEELNNARHPYSVVPDEDSSDELYDVNEDQGSSSESSSDHKSNISSKKKVRSRLQALAVDKNPAKEVDGGGTVMLQETVWASMELLELVAHMRNGDQSFISQFDVQALLLDYIKKYNLRDPRRKSQIICDLRLRNLFGKERVGHFEMLKLLESHFLSKEAPQVVEDGNQVETSDTDNKLTDDVEEDDTFARVVTEKRRKSRKRTEEIEPQMNVDDYAAVDIHNITLIFLRRSLLEDLLDDVETFNDKVVGSFVRIRISNAGQRQDLYRLVQIVGTQESSKPYKVGKKTTDIVLEILNLNKKETSTIDSISNQDFTEEECQRLRQSIKCGLIDRLKVGYIQEKAKALHAVRVNDSIEAEKLRLSHLRDRASETGRRKELRECVEKLQLLNNLEERRRRLTEIPQIHADPKMDPEYESSEEGEDDKNQDYQIRSKEVLSLRKRRELIPRGRAGILGNNWNGMNKNHNFNRESSRRMPGENWQDRSDMYNNMAERPNEVPLNQSKEVYQIEASFNGLQSPSQGNYTPKSLERHSHGSAPEVNLVNPEGSLPSITNEVDKIWHYQDPSMNIQGPFSLSQLRKWNTTGYFPPDMKIWRTSEKQEDSKLLADVLVGRFYKDPPQLVTQHGSFPDQPTWVDSQQTRGNWNAHQNMKQQTLDGLSALPPVWSLTGVEVSNSSEGKPGTYSSTWSGNPRPAGPIYNNPYHIPIYPEAGRGGNGNGWNQEQDYGNIWSPTRPMVGMPSESQKVEDNLTSDPSIVSASTSANELHGRMNKYQSYESDCPSPTPRTERKESFLRHDELGPSKNRPETLGILASNCTTPVGSMAVNHGPAAATLGILDSSLASHPTHPTCPASINVESSNTASAVGFTDKIPGNGMQKIDGTKFVSSDFKSSLSPVAVTADDIGSGHAQRLELSSIQKIDTGFQAIAHTSVQKRFTGGSNLTPSLHGMEHDQSQNPDSNFSPIHQANRQNASEVESSLPSPTPKSSKNTSSNLSSENQKLPTVQNANNTSWGGAPQGNAGWGTPAFVNANASTDWGTLEQGNSNTNTNTNTAWGATATQVNATANTGWGTLIPNANTGWVAPVQVNANANIGWGLPVQLNANTNTGWGNGWGASSTTGLGNSNPIAAAEAVPMHDNDASVRAAGWGSAYGSRNEFWKSSDRDNSRRFDYEGRNGDGYSHHRDRDIGRRGGGNDPWNSRVQSDGRGSSRPHQAFAGGDGHRGVCKFYEGGHCKKGRSCKFLHNDLRRDI
ncbi:hypothetical protein M5K25_026374 [Dendrobium thyrsiflorum]|uniref:Zinc finger CCCH domain-containing protein 19 n=1 Tax=Dendrobium thyrsiflorum TaxID=117978 RepID=A0ABD0TXE2_DENTH